MRLIVDAGSTKTEWIVLDGEKVMDRFTLGGYNPSYNESIVLIDLLYKDLREDFPAMDAVFYYGSGCGSEANREEVAQILRVRFEEANEVMVTHDLMAACHALLGHGKGIACILGTGSNSCVYDGANITGKAVSLGYLVGDEGSGTHIGREVVRAYFYGLMPEELRQKFAGTYSLRLPDFVQNLYHNAQPSRYLASFAKFAGDNCSHPYVHDLVKRCFQAFIEVFILRFDDCKTQRVSFVGSVAWHFKDILEESLAENGLTMGMVLQTPAEGLIRFFQG